MIIPPAHIAANIPRTLPLLNQLISQHLSGDYRGLRFSPVELFGVSITTAMSHLRSTATWLMNNPTYPVDLNRTAAKDIWHLYQWKFDDDGNHIVVVPRTPKERPTAPLSIEIDKPITHGQFTETKLKSDAPYFAERVRALCCCCYFSQFEPRLLVTIEGEFPQELLEEMTNKYPAVNIVREKDHWVII